MDTLLGTGREGQVRTNASGSSMEMVGDYLLPRATRQPRAMYSISVLISRRMITRPNDRTSQPRHSLTACVEYHTKGFQLGFVLQINRPLIIPVQVGEIRLLVYHTDFGSPSRRSMGILLVFQFPMTQCTTHWPVRPDALLSLPVR